MKSPNPGGRPKRQRADALENMVTGLGGALHKGGGALTTLTKATVADMRGLWDSNLLIKRVVEWAVDDALPYVLPPEIADNVEAAALHYAFIDALHTAAQYDRAYGGSALLAVTEDNAPTAQPLLSVRNIARFVPLTPEEFEPGDIESNPFTAGFRKPTVYTIGDAVVHTSRIFVLGDRDAPGSAQLAQDAIEMYTSALKSTSHLVGDFSQTIMRIKGLADILASGNAEAVKGRVAAMDKTRSALRAIILDGDTESFERQTVTLAGLPEAVRTFAEYMSAATEMPLTMLLGLTPAGLTNSTETDRKYWEATVSRLRNRLKPAVQWFDAIAQMTGVPALGPVVWEEINPPSQDAILDRQLKRAQVDQILITSGVLDPESVIPDGEEV